MPHRLRFTVLASLLVLAACAGAPQNNLAALDNELMGNAQDPALTSALEDQILVDPNLVGQSQPNSARPAEAPIQAQYPEAADPTRPGAVAGGARVQQASGTSGAVQGVSSCGANYQYGPEWANRLPAAFPAYPGGRVTEAAGHNDGGCRMRVVTFTTGDPYGRVLEHYRSLAARAGFTAEHQRRGADHVLGGTNQSTDGAFYLIVTPVQGGSEVALIANHGR